MSNKTGLGRGLSALLPETQPGESGFQYLGIDKIEPNPRQPRERFDEAAIEVLADSIARVGVLQPLIVRRAPSGLELIAGERRLRAARKAGLQEIPVIIKETSDEESLEQALVENIHRENLNPLEEAAAYKQLLEDFSLTHEGLASRVGRSRAAISNTLRLLGLPGEIQELLISGAISGGHARALLGIEDPARQKALAHRIVEEGLTVRQVEEAAKQADKKPGSTTSGGKQRQPAALLEVGELMGEYLNTRVDVKMGKGAGRMTIEFGSIEDLERITQMILGPFEG